ncbi:RNA-binding protein [Alkalicella caledoniensis]|uniref:RNA-binding protein n=1 Tax=Alkalicella caledoniensis TaxID=2731377 RepID=A0A7G9W7V6_ALKCA|nr:KOW domain-containing RNA-binding protein [Alkalicella caledoniensis]QNO14768.1 RNA-binding protein [Alkalicella caledoniensis]
MTDVQIGNLVRSKKGRDKDKLYVILELQGDRVTLVDGKFRTIKKPKQKNVKHIRLVSNQSFIKNPAHLTDEKIAFAISTFEQEDS